MPPEKYYDEQYSKDFLSDKKLNKEALERALDIRKFEIDLYWKRATYFWTFIAATLAGFVVVQASAASNKEAMSVLLACLGIVFSVGWVCVNRGSKFWQENWESHVDMLEDEIGPPLYKVVISKQGTVGLERLSHFLTGPGKFSVSKINQLISLFVTIMWVGLLCYSLPLFRCNVPIALGYIGLIVLTVVTCGCFFKYGRTSEDDSILTATKRSVKMESNHKMMPGS